MGKIAFLFSGQGAQYPGMGQELSQVSPAAAAVFAMADALRPGTSEQCFTGTKEELTVTSNTQPDMYAVELAAAAALTRQGVEAVETRARVWTLTGIAVLTLLAVLLLPLLVNGGGAQ